MDNEFRIAQDALARIDRICATWEGGTLPSWDAIRQVTEIVAEYTDPASEVEPGPDPAISDAVLACPDCDRPNQFGQVCDSCEGDRQSDLLIQSDADGID